MKTKFTLLIAAGLLVSVATMAQDRGYDHGDRGNGYGYDNRNERREHFDSRDQLYNLQERLEHEMNEFERARECGDWEKARHERMEIAEIRQQIRELKYHRWHDDDYRDHRYHERF